VTDTMPAVICRAPHDYRLEEVAVPVPGPGEALVRVEAVGICASDVKCYHGAPKFWGDATTPGYVHPGVVPGHEFTGVVVELGAGAGERWRIEVGDRVVSEQIVPCWDCRYCRRGQYWMCAVHDIYGFRRRTPGAMAPYMIFPEGALVHRVDRGVPAVHAAFAEPLSCALHAVERATIAFEDVVVVAGCGPIGLGMVAGARARSPQTIVALDASPARLDLARACGADVTVDIAGGEADAVIGELTGGYGADVYLDATGHPSSVVQGLRLLRKLGTFVEYGVFGAEVTVDWTVISDDKELDVRGAHLGPHCWPAAIRMIEEGVLPLERICSHQLPLGDFASGLDLVAEGTRSVKVTLLPETA
jgi:threonine dehydrogenase-like Zn-dependent dehydrogenase